MEVLSLTSSGGVITLVLVLILLAVVLVVLCRCRGHLMIVIMVSRLLSIVGISEDKSERLLEFQFYLP